MTDEPIFERGRLTLGQLAWLKRILAFLFWIFTRIECAVWRTSRPRAG